MFLLSHVKFAVSDSICAIAASMFSFRSID